MAPVQKRAIATRGKILDALESLLKTEEFERIAIADIAREAGVAVGSVYSHFKDKDALLPSLLERRFDRVVAQIDQAHRVDMDQGKPVADAKRVDLKSMLRAILIGARRRVREDRGMLRALLTYRRLYPDQDDPRRASLTVQGVDSLKEALAPYRADIRIADPDQAARIIYYFVSVSYLEEAVFSPTPSVQAVTPTDDEKLEAYTQMLYLYLTT